MAKKISRLWMALFVFLPMWSEAQCAMCKAVAESNSNGGGAVADGLNNGIVYLMFFPYLLAVTVGVLWYRHNKKTRSEQA